MERRTLLKYLGISAAGISLSVCMESLAAASTNENKGIAWGYIGENGPEQWGNLSPDFQICSLGGEQSPINIETPVLAKIGDVKVSYQTTPLRIVNNGHTIQVNYNSSSKITFRDQTFELRQFHFHTPSEHTYQGISYDMELHLVHQDQDNNLAVLGVFLKQGQPNQALQEIWNAMPMTKGLEQTIPGVMVNAEELLPKRRDFDQYVGSLTTPPCSEGVNWIVFEEPIELSLEQLQKFKQAIPMNARPVQKLNERFALQQQGKGI